MSDRTSHDRLLRKSERGFQGYPLGTVALYGPDLARATKVAVGIVHKEGGEPREMEKWLSEVTDVREDEVVGGQVLAFLQRHGVRSVVVGPGILGCPHEEGIDYPVGGVCPRCPYWAGRERPI
jgi:hypothetical protein